MDRGVGSRRPPVDRPGAIDRESWGSRCGDGPGDRTRRGCSSDVGDRRQSEHPARDAGGGEGPDRAGQPHRRPRDLVDGQEPAAGRHPGRARGPDRGGPGEPRGPGQRARRRSGAELDRCRRGPDDRGGRERVGRPGANDRDIETPAGRGAARRAGPGRGRRDRPTAGPGGDDPCRCGRIVARREGRAGRHRLAIPRPASLRGGRARPGPRRGRHRAAPGGGPQGDAARAGR